jgi:hypothetical protein
MMKFLLPLTLLLSLNSFAQDRLGYVCLPKSEADALKLQKLSKKIGKDYLKEIGVLIVRPETCVDIHAAIYQDVCKAGPFTVTIGLEGEDELIVSPTQKVALACESDQPVDIFPVR